MLKVQLVDSATGKELHSHEGWEGEPLFTVTTHGAREGHFQSATVNGAATTTIVEAKGDGAVVLTDLIVSTDKTAGSSTTLQFSDGVDTVVLAVFDSANAPVTLAIAFAGHWQGWAGANLQMITDTANQDVTVSAGYFHVSEDAALLYGEWDAIR